MHSHPAGTYPMFSWNDMRVLRNYFEEANEDFQDDVFLMIVNNDGTVYALKINDSLILDIAINHDMNITVGDTNDEKIENLNQSLQTEFSKNNNLELTFLKIFEDYGATLYKAVDQNLSSWNQLDLNNTKDQVIMTTCN